MRKVNKLTTMSSNNSSARPDVLDLIKEGGATLERVDLWADYRPSAAIDSTWQGGEYRGLSTPRDLSSFFAL